MSKLKIKAKARPTKFNANGDAIEFVIDGAVLIHEYSLRLKRVAWMPLFLFEAPIKCRTLTEARMVTRILREYYRRLQKLPNVCLPWREWGKPNGEYIGLSRAA
jgi:hypothetical protein